jgi:3-phenylpropionate/cinnamic acid dioxygenase small subunit
MVRSPRAGASGELMASQLNFRSVENFLFHEARLMDENAYEEWLSLWASNDICYWVPGNAEEADPAEHISIIYDNRKRLEARIKRLASGYAFAQDPKSRMRRVVSNIEINEEADGIVATWSNFTLGEFRRGTQDIFVGRTMHKLRPEEASFKIVFKKVLLINSEGYIDNLTFLV